MLVIIRGAGDIATGIALRLHRAGLQVVMTDLPQPTAIRRTVCFSQAIVLGSCTVEQIRAVRAGEPEEVKDALSAGCIPVLADPDAACIAALHPDAVVDAILAKRNLGTSITDAPVVVAVGPGFEAGTDCHAVVETMRGHYLGRVNYSGSALPNTNIPGLIGGYAGERVLRAPADGVFHACLQIGDQVQAGDVAATVADVPMVCTIGGILRGLLADGTPVHQGMKAGDVDPRCELQHCYCASDKALAVGGGVLEAILHLSGALRSPAGYRLLPLRYHPDLLEPAAAWFHSRWGVPPEAYRDSIRQCLGHPEQIPQWYVAVDPAGTIAAGAGLIANDFHPRPDLTPNVCALYVDPPHRRRGLARRLLNAIRADAAALGWEQLYLITDHTGFYEACGWSFLDSITDNEGRRCRVYTAAALTACRMEDIWNRTSN